MRKIYFTLLFCCFLFVVNAQTPGVKFSRSVGGTLTDRSYDVQKTLDGGFLTVGNTSSNDGDVSGYHSAPFSPPDILVVKTNVFGNIEWQKCFGGTGTDEFKKLIYNPDGTALIIGITNSSNGDVINFHGNQDIWIIKIDGTGNIVWQKSLGGANLDDFRSVDRSTDNGYIIAGYTGSNDGDISGNHGGEDIWVFKLSELGIIEWQKCLGGTNNERPRFIMSMSDGNFIIVGSTSSTDGNVSVNHGSNDLWVIKLNSSGSFIWEKTYGGTNSETGFQAVASNKGSITVLANALSSDGDVIGHNGTSIDVWVVDVSYDDGAINWQKCIGGSSTETPVTLLKDAQGMFLIASTTTSFDGDAVTNRGQQDILLNRLTSSGILEWSQCFGSLKNDNLYDIYNDTTSQSFIMAASIYQASGDVVGFHQNAQMIDTLPDAWIVNVDYSGDIKWQRSLGGSDIDVLYSIKQSGKGNFILAGETSSFDGEVKQNAGRIDAWIVQLGAINTIKGTLFIDNNLNGVKDNEEPYYSNAIVTSTKINDNISSVPFNGLFFNEIDTGDYQTSISLNPVYYNVVPSSINSTFNSYFNTDSISFALQPIPNKKDLVINAIPLTVARPGFNTTYKIYYKNIGTTTIPSGEILFKKDSRLSLVSSFPAISSSNGDTLKWGYSNLGPADTASITLQMRIQAPPAVNNGDTLISVAIITPVTGDESPSDDTAFIKHRVTGSFDPNDKYENNGGIIRPEHITNGDYLNYTIRFQNTGTDTAFTVVVRDTLDAKMEWSTLQMISASHSYDLSIAEEDKLTWTFSNINLADSNINEPASHGFIAYRIKPKNTVAIGDTIHNFASIYFDYNLPVLTNNAFTTVQTEIVLPLKLISFTGTCMNNITRLIWTTQGEYDFEKFVIERSVNGREFISIGNKLSGGVANTITEYRFNDDLAALQNEIFYYRLKMLDIDGRIQYSAVIAIRKAIDSKPITVFPNPVVNGIATAIIHSNSNIVAKLKVIDGTGKILWTKNQQLYRGSNSLTIENLAFFPQGIYTIQVISGTQIINKQILISR